MAAIWSFGSVRLGGLGLQPIAKTIQRSRIQTLHQPIKVAIDIVKRANRNAGAVGEFARVQSTKTTLGDDLLRLVQDVGANLVPIERFSPSHRHLQPLGALREEANAGYTISFRLEISTID